MTFNPDLDTTHEEYDLAIALGYLWVARVHAGEPVPISEYNLERDPFTIDGDQVIIREVALNHAGKARSNHRGDRAIRRVRRVPLPSR